MSLRFVKLVAVVSALAMPLHAAPIELGKQFFHKDWAAACDNIFVCEAVSLMPEAQEGEPPSVSVTRDGAGTVRIGIAFAQAKGERYRIFVDRRLIDSGTLAKGDYPVRLEGAAALKLARAMARGKKLVVRGADDALLDEVSLGGTAAAFAHIDSAQGRARTRDALFVTGKRIFKAQPPAPPTISAQRIGKQEAIPDAGAIVGLVESSACADDRVGVTEDSAYSLGRHGGSYKALVMLSCGSGAYNFSFAPFIGTSTDGKKWSFAPARFDYPAKANVQSGGIALLVNSGWEPESQQISSYAKGRGLGDCGSAENYVWDGEMFRLIEAHGMDECRGSTQWPRLWTAKVEFRD